MRETDKERPLEPIVLVTCFDGAYLIPATVLLKSIEQSTPREQLFEVHIFYADMPREGREKVSASLDPGRFKIKWIKASHRRLVGVAIGPGSSYAAYFRLFLGEIETSSDRVIYLDSDTIVLHDIRDLWRESLGQRPVRAVPDAPATVKKMEASPLFAGCSASRPFRYFNSGVMLIDLNFWRSSRLGERALEILKKQRPHIRFYDQDALNLLLLENWEPLSHAWNVQVSDAASTSRDARIAHFAWKKPWQDGELRYGSEYERFKSLTVFKDVSQRARLERSVYARARNFLLDPGNGYKRLLAKLLRRPF